MKIELMKIIADEGDDVEKASRMFALLDCVPAERHLLLAQALKECDCHACACLIAADLGVLESRTIEEQVELMKTLKECDYNLYAHLIATDLNVLESRTIEEQVELMKTLKECDYHACACLIAIDPKLLITRTVEEQIELMIEAYKKSEVQREKQEVPHKDNMQNIKDLNALRAYVNALEKLYGADTDISADTIVPVYTFTNKSEK